MGGVYLGGCAESIFVVVVVLLEKLEKLLEKLLEKFLEKFLKKHKFSSLVRQETWFTLLNTKFFKKKKK